jgi:hypothetical protein
MPNRVIKDSLKRSPQIDSLTWFEEVVFVRLIITVDDYGCTDGRMVVLKSDLFPTKESITKKALEDAITRLAQLGLIILYEANGLPYVFLPTWDKHQRIRNQHRKYPPPPDCHLTADCGQMTADCLPESQSNPNPNNICPSDAGRDGSEEQTGSREDDFKIIYAIYPKKVGKSKAYEHYLGWLKGRVINGKRIVLSNEKIYDAVKKYVDVLAYRNTELKFYQDFSTFMNKTILDYLEEES